MESTSTHWPGSLASTPTAHSTAPRSGLKAGPPPLPARAPTHVPLRWTQQWRAASPRPSRLRRVSQDPRQAAPPPAGPVRRHRLRTSRAEIMLASCKPTSAQSSVLPLFSYINTDPPEQREANESWKNRYERVHSRRYRRFL